MKSARARVLVVEDEAIVAKDIAATLKGMNYHVTGIAGTGEEAVTLASATHPDLVLMDIMLPGDMDGIEAARRIQTRLGIPIVFLTAHADESTLTRAKAAAPYGYLIKPFVERELEVALETARYRASMERQLDEQRRWFEAVLRGIGDAVIAANVHGAITFMNPVAERLTEWTSVRAMGQPLSTVFRTVDARTHETVEAAETRALRDETALAEEPEDLLLIAADGVERPISSTVSPIHDAKGNLLGVVAVFKDVSARKMVEKRILNRQKMQAMGRLSSSIAHDFNNAISLIAGHVASMQEYTLPGSRAYEDVHRIQAAVEHAASLTKRILGVARASDSEGDLLIRSVPLGEIVQSALGLLRDTFDKKNVVTDIVRPDRMPVVSVDSSHMVDVLMDLFLNAADAMPNGGSITINARRVRLLKPVPKLNPNAKPGSYALLRIQDTGAGMSPHMLEHIFEPFFTTKSPDLHVGLGLSVAHSAIQRYNGWIRVASKPGHGSTFSIYIPEASEESRRDAERAARLVTGSILVVDDDEPLRAEIRHTLKQAGYKVHLAGSADEALALIRQNGTLFDLAIIDVIMPDKDGQEVLTALMAVNPSAQALMTCGFSRDYVRSVLSRGAWRFLQKPFEPEQLLGAVRRALEQKPT